MYKIAVIGKTEVISGFKALGFEVGPVDSLKEAREKLAEFSDCAIIFITEDLALELKEELKSVKPIITLIPTPTGSLGLAEEKIKSIVTKAIGVEIK